MRRNTHHMTDPRSPLRRRLRLHTRIADAGIPVCTTQNGRSTMILAKSDFKLLPNKPKTDPTMTPKPAHIDPNKFDRSWISVESVCRG